MNNPNPNGDEREYQQQDADEPMVAEMNSINISESGSADSNMDVNMNMNMVGNGHGNGHGNGVRRSLSMMSEDEDEDSMEVEELIAMERVGTSTTAGATNTTTNTNVSSMRLEDTHHELDATVIKRRAIQAIRRDPNLDEQTKRFRIQQLMDGSAMHSSANASASASSARTTICTPVPSSSLLRNSSSTRSASDFASSSVGLTGAGNSISSSSSAARRSSSYQPNAAATASASASSSDVMKCLHYEGRKCNIVAPCCGKIFGCRVCHDEMVTDGHEMNRFMVREVVCKECHTRQERSNNCIKCGVTFGEYHCNICNLWMNTTKQPFHCAKCGICRVGGRENFVHCDECDMCISQSTYNNHLCLKDKFKNSCPICFENMHSSRHAALDLPCGHAIHTHCFRKLAAFDYRCPICKKTVVNSDTMSRAWTERAREIQSQPMPDDLARTVDIWCNDCEVKSEGRDWHFLGVQCPNCRSFNTAVENNVSRSGH